MKSSQPGRSVAAPGVTRSAADIEPMPPLPAAPGLEQLLREVRACTLCAGQIPQPPRPVLQAGSAARILIAAQAPGRKVAASGIPFDDASGERLRDWMGVDKAVFHDPQQIAILPMGFCYPGTGRTGDLPPRPECAATWRSRLLEQLPKLRLTLLLGRHAQAWHLDRPAGETLTETVRNWRSDWPRLIALPHPSPLNNRWLFRNRWFEHEVLPPLRAAVAELLGRPS